MGVPKQVGISKNIDLDQNVAIQGGILRKGKGILARNPSDPPSEIE